MYFSWAITEEENPFQAGKELATKANAYLSYRKASVGVVFSTVHLAKESLLKGIKSTLGKVKLVGCSGEGIISPYGIKKFGAGLLLLSLEEENFSLEGIEFKNLDDDKSNGEKLAWSLLKNLRSSQRELFILFSSLFYRDEFIEGIKIVLGRSFPILGGVAVTELVKKESIQFLNENLFREGIGGLLLGGKIRVSWGYFHGLKPLGKPRIITKASGNLLEEIEGRPAKYIYKEYLDLDLEKLTPNQKFQVSSLYPLGFYLENEEEYLLRTPIDVNSQGALLCQGNIPKVKELRLMIGTKETLLSASSQAAQEANKPLKENRKFFIIFESSSRNKVLGRANEREIQIFKKIWGEQTGFLGILTLGEFAPLKSLRAKGETLLHNQTVTILGIGDVS